MQILVLMYLMRSVKQELVTAMSLQLIQAYDHEQVLQCLLETSTGEEESSEPDHSDDENSDFWCKTDKTPTDKPFPELQH